jgi:hypothetical protein
VKAPPDEGELLDFLTDNAERQRILVDNPARLFGFAAQREVGDRNGKLFILAILAALRLSPTSALAQARPDR